MKSVKNILFAVFFSVALLGCDDEQPLATQPPYIETVFPLASYPGAEVIITGKHFGTPKPNSFLMLDSIAIFRASECKLWNDSKIIFVVPAGAQSGKLSVMLDSIRSNEISITLAPVTPFDTVLVGAGDFYMGSDVGLEDEKPIHLVKISSNFTIGKYEVTQLLWESVMGTNPSGQIGSSLPVVNVSWLEAVKFCNRLSVIYGWDSCYHFVTSDSVVWLDGANGWRLPTEAEWEYACRAGSINEIAGSGNPYEMAWYNQNSGFNLHSVGSKLPNDWNIFDMHGNAREWCWDYYSANYYSISPMEDPKGPETGTRRVSRGGSASDGNAFIRASARTYPHYGPEHQGFRIVRTLKN